MPTRVLAHWIDLLGAGLAGSLPRAAPAGVGVRVLDGGGVRVSLETPDFAPLRELATSAVARALLGAATATVATAVRAEAEHAFMSAPSARGFYDLVRRGYPRGDFDPRAAEGPWPVARYAVDAGGWRGTVELLGAGPQAFRSALRLERPPEPAGAAAAALEGLERVAAEWTRELLAHGYTP